MLECGEGKGSSVGGVGKCDRVWGRCGEELGEVWSTIFTDPISDRFAVFQCTQLPVSTLRTSNAENIRIFNDDNIHRFQKMLDDVSWHEVYEQNDLDLAFTMF